MNLIEHTLLTLDFWQDNVTYERKSMPTGTLACAALNLSDEVIAKLSQLCTPLNLYMGSLQLGQADTVQMEAARESAFQIVELLRNVPPFSCLEYEIVRSYIDTVFTEDYLQNAIDFARSGNLAGAVSPEYQKALTLLRVLPVMAHLGFSLAEFKRELLPFAEKLHESDRTPDGYAASFGQYFSVNPDMTADNPGWMSLANASVQYATATIPGKEKSQLVKRMHYVSFVGMFRSDLFEGLCVGHAPRKCPICGTWFLTTDARPTKYCGGLAPGDRRGRTCRQVGNLRGREQRERADDHPLKKIYERRTNTIIQKLHRGTLDEQTAAVMKRLAKNKLERAIADREYATRLYEAEMAQERLLAEAGSLHAIQLRRKSVKRAKKKIAAAVYEYQADCDGEWGEIQFDFVSSTGSIVQLAEWDTISSHVFAERIIRYILALPENRLPISTMIAFEGW